MDLIHQIKTDIILHSYGSNRSIGSLHIGVPVSIIVDHNYSD